MTASDIKRNMSDTVTYKDNFPRAALVGAGLLLLVTVIVCVGARFVHLTPAAQVPADTQPVASRALKFEDRPNGDVVVYAADTDQGRQQVAVLPPGTNGFLRAVMRGLVQARKFQDTGPQTPFMLSELPDGRLVLSDPTTGRHIYLRAFGPTNAEAFAKLLPEAAQHQRQAALGAVHE